MKSLAEAAIVFQPHAIARARERFPDITRKTMKAEVRAALHAGRFSAARPVWLAAAAPGRRFHNFYAWTDGRERTYAIFGGDTAWHIHTVMAQNERA